MAQHGDGEDVSAAVADDAELWTPPPWLDEFRVVRPLGRGGMGRVYYAYDSSLARPVALKFIDQREPDQARRERFLIEARALARLHSLNVAAVYRTGEVGGHPYIAYEFVPGISLDHLPKPIPWRQVLHVAAGLARGIAAAHAAGVLHRDIKPGNVLLTESGDVKLVDFGVAKLLDRPDSAAHLPLEAPEPRSSRGSKQASVRSGERVLPVAERAETESPAPASDARRLTEHGFFVGTPMYAAPELWSGTPANSRSDVFAFGLLVYELLTGRLPKLETRAASASADWPGTDLQAPEVDAPRELCAFVDRCIAFDPAHRPAAGPELLEELYSVVAATRALISNPDDARVPLPRVAPDEASTGLARPRAGRRAAARTSTSEHHFASARFGVSAAARQLLISELSLAGLAGDDVERTLRPHPSGFSSWTDYLTACDIAAELCGGPAEFADMVESTVIGAVPDLAALAPLFPSTASFARFAIRSIDATSFVGCRYEVAVLEPRKLLVRLRAAGGWELRPTIVAGIAGALRTVSIPLQVGATKVEPVRGAESGVFELALPACVRPPTAASSDGAARGLSTLLRQQRRAFEHTHHLASLLSFDPARTLDAPVGTPAEGRIVKARKTWKLTPRESEILGALCTGLTDAQIAAALDHTASAVERTVARILVKSGISERAILVARYYQL